MPASNTLRVLVTGAGGQLGRSLLLSAPEGWHVEGHSRQDCDIGDASSVAGLLAATSPDAVINAAAYTAVDRAEHDREAAMQANATAPGILAKACGERGIRFLHVSTDFVFDGHSDQPYALDAPTAPLGVYGESKLAGEEAVSAAHPNSVILRTSWVYSPFGTNFLRTMLRLHAERDELAVVADQVGSPTAAASLARALWAAADRPAVTGIHHWSDAGVCSWYDFAVAIGEEAESCGLIDRAAAVRPIATEDYPTAARRPAYSVLDTRATAMALECSARHWRDELRSTLNTMITDTGGRAHGA
jgi:dTDP-4-dehydrorhamnose reductase